MFMAKCRVTLDFPPLPILLALLVIPILPLPSTTLLRAIEQVLHFDRNPLYDCKNYTIQLHIKSHRLRDQSDIHHSLLLIRASHFRHFNYSHPNSVLKHSSTHSLMFVHEDCRLMPHLIFDYIRPHFHVLNFNHIGSHIVSISRLRHRH